MNSTQTQQAKRRRLQGTVISAKMQKTVVVRVDRMKKHPKYGKAYTQTTKFKVHDAEGVAKVGDVVTIEECRPISKNKCWRLISTAAKTEV